MDNEVNRYELKECPDCEGRGVSPENLDSPVRPIPPCDTCKGLRYVPKFKPCQHVNGIHNDFSFGYCRDCGDWISESEIGEAPEDKPRQSVLEALQAQLREQSENNADLFRQMEAEAHRADEAEARYQRVAAGLADEIKALKAELAALKVGLLDIEAWAQKSYVVSTAAHRIITEKVSALLSRKGDD